MAGSDSSEYVCPGGELSLSNLGQLELLRGMSERGFPLRTQIRGGSMSPWIRDGDVATIAPMNERGPRVGDIVAYVQPATGRLALHRIVGRQSAGWLVRGDSCRRSDGIITSAEVLGRVVRLERGGCDVGLTGGFGGTVIAVLSRTGAIAGLTRVRRSPRRIGTALLRTLQGLRPYRAVAGSMAARTEVREAATADLQALRNVFNLSKVHPDFEETPDPCVVSWVATRGERVVGGVQLRHVADAASPWAGCWLFSLMVRSRFRGMGVGEALASLAIVQARESGAEHISVVVLEENRAAVRLYEKLSFSRVSLHGLEDSLQAELESLGPKGIIMRKYL